MRNVILKLGARGCYVATRDGRRKRVPGCKVTAVDTTGAGDAYCGGFVAGWLATGSPAVAAACGTIAAGEMIGRYGAFADGSPTDPAARATALESLLAGLPSDDRDGADPGVLAARIRHAFNARSAIL